MIELRWLQKQGASARGSVSIGGNLFQTLQYRTIESTFETNDCCVESVWTEWKNVPVNVE